jgi:two-component system response regulator RegA
VSGPKTCKLELERLLIVEDNDALRRALGLTLAEHASEVRTAATVEEAELAIREWHPDAIVLDFSLPDGDAFDLLCIIANTEPMPVLVVMSGMAAPEESFLLPQMGVRAFVPKPLEPEAVERALARALVTAPDLAPMIRTAVGRIGVHTVEEQVRATMVAEAMARTHGSRSAAARLLAVSRQVLQHFLKKARLIPRW